MAVTSATPTLSSTIEAKSSHLADTSIQPFLQPDFDPVAHLNASLPTLNLSQSTRSTQSLQNGGKPAALPELSTQLQSLLSQLNAQATRVTNALTQLTDEIIRSGGRLAYEVEVLRGETLDLTESFENELKKDIELFVPSKGSNHRNSLLKEESTSEAKETNNGAATDRDINHSDDSNPNKEPEYLERLRTLTAVRARLDSVIKVFGDAMQWPIAPSELSLASSLISVSNPDTEDGKSLEEKGKAFSEKLRNEVADLIAPGNDVAGIEAAHARIADLRQLAEVWKGTSEEKARLKLVENLQKLVDDRQKAIDKGSSAAPSRQTALPARGVDMRYGNLETGAQGGYGFLQNLRNLKTDVYLE